MEAESDSDLAFDSWWEGKSDMASLCLLVHADPSVGHKYQQALAGVSGDWELAIGTVPGFSSAYVQLGAKLKRKPGSLLETLAEFCGAQYPVTRYERVILVTFSAGYAMAREILADPISLEQLGGYVALDSIHSGFDPDGTARDAQLAGFVRMALRAADGPHVCWVGHTDVQTYGYASTTQTAEEIQRLTELRRQTEAEIYEVLTHVIGKDKTWTEEGGFRVESFDLTKNQKREHSKALTDWGPAFVAEAAATLLAREKPANGTIQAMHSTPAKGFEPLGIRALEMAKLQQSLNVREIRGPRHHPKIVEYFARCERNGANIGRYLSTDEFAWCAAFASYCAFESTTNGEQVPHKYRASVRELWADAIASGTAVAVQDCLRGKYSPQLGDLIIMTRGGPAMGSGKHAFAKSAGKGHVGRVMRWQGAEGATLDGNVNDTITEVKRSLFTPDMVGIISYPGPVNPPVGFEAVEVLANLPDIRRVA